MDPIAVPWGTSEGAIVVSIDVLELEVTRVGTAFGINALRD